MYSPHTPPGYGDQFYMYAYQPSANGQASAGTYSNLPIEIQDSDFVLRAYAGLDSVLLTGPPISGNGSVQIYDDLNRGFYQIPTVMPGQFPTGQSVTPERIYRTNSALRFDLITTNLATNVSGPNTVPVDQLCFYGARRFKGAQSDPENSNYKYYEKEYDIPFQVTLASNGTTTGLGPTTQYTLIIQDFDFELRRIEGGKLTGAVYSPLSPTNPEFAMTLYDSHWVKRSNLPINSNRLCHFPLSASNPQNSWPSLGILYPVNTVVRFDIGSLVATGATLPTLLLLFKGVRRIPCQ